MMLRTNKKKLKISKAQIKNYIIRGEVISFNYMFSGTKGVDYIRVVYNGTPISINDYMWDPHITMPTLRNTLRAI